ncbi:acetyl-CoA carboxylase carboxyl transferase subunit alpha, partial [Candidatus Sumerlaeota bacterium]|nr:acetyl-CoA carboxylase carboxyl transferase subunit alpha [Candidatus Sumerlaeota bacterium]
MAAITFDFEKPILEIEARIGKLEEAPEDAVDREKNLKELQEQLESTRREVYENLNPWQRVQIARHASRPHALDYIRQLITDWNELHGDRHFGDDKAVVTGVGRFDGRPVAVIGQQKGADT